MSRENSTSLACASKTQSHPPLLAGQAGNAGRTFLHTVRKGFPKVAARLGSTLSHFLTASFLISYSTAANMAGNDSSAQGKTQRTSSTIHWRPPFPIHLHDSQNTSLSVGFCYTKPLIRKCDSTPSFHTETARQASLGQQGIFKLQKGTVI